MTKAKVLAIFVLVLAVASVATTACATAAAQEGSPSKPNIVLILADDMRKDDLEHMPKTQSLIVGEGMTFDNAFVTTSQCCPSRATFLRGQYVHNHDVRDNALPNGGFKKFRDLGHEESTVATWLNDAGYRTALFGKYLNEYDDEDYSHVPPGWDEWYARLQTARYYDYNMSENGRKVHYGSSASDYLTDVLARKASSFIDRAAGSPDPLFMYVAPNAPHSPYQPAPRHATLFPGVEVPSKNLPSYDEADVSDKPSIVASLPRLTEDDKDNLDRIHRKRLQMLQSVDDMVEKIVNKLAQTGRLQNSYIFFTSDNGALLGEHREQGRKDVQKGLAYEESIKMPLVVRGPGIPAGRSTDQLAINPDFAPTFADLGGATVPTFVDGRSFVPLFAADPPSWRTAFGEEFYQPNKRHLSIKTADGKKYVYWRDTGEEELYDLNTDPYEVESKHASPEWQATKETLATRLNALKTCAGESCRAAEDGP